MILVLHNNRIVLQASTAKQLKKRWNFDPALQGLAIFEVKGGKYAELDRTPTKYKVSIQLQRMKRELGFADTKEKADALVHEDAIKRKFQVELLQSGHFNVTGQPYVSYYIVPVEWDFNVPSDAKQSTNGVNPKASSTV